MANNTETQKPKERVKYKFGQSDIDLTNYIHNLGTNVQSYLNSKNWNDGQKQEFMNAYNRYLTGLQDQLANNTNRFTTDDFGSIIDSTGALSNTDNDDIDPVGSEYYYDDKGNRITTDDFNALKKRKQKNYNTFSANREVATYFNAIGNALRSKQPTKEQTSNAFDLSKHGFLADWTRINNPAGGNLNLDPYLEKDAVDEATGKRSTTNRAAYLKEQIENYINNIGDYDFSSTPFKDRNTYVSRLRAAAENLGNGYNSEDVIALNQAGIGNEFLSKFFSTGTTESAGTEAQQAAQYIAQQEREKQEQEVIEQANKLRAMSALNQYIKDNPFESRHSGFLDGGDYNAESILKTLEDDYSSIEGDDNKVKAWINFQQILKDLKTPIIEGDKFNSRISTREGSQEQMRILRQNIAKKLKFAAQEGYMKSYGDNEYIIPGSENYTNYSVMTYNPTTGEYKDQSILLNEKLKEAMAYDWYKKNQSIPSNKMGGVLSYLQEGGFMKRAREARKQKQQEEQQKQSQKEVYQEQGDTRTQEQKEAGQRKISDGLSGTDIARLAAIGMDLTSAISSFVPGAGTAVSGITGIGSTLTTFGADIAEDGFQLSDLGNAATGLGMDIVGLIPGFGTAGKAAKIGKQLVKFAPLVLGALQAKNALSESSLASWKKITDGKFKDLTVDDLRNLAAGVTAFTSLSNQAGIRMKSSAMKSATKTGDKLLQDKTGEMIRVTPEQLESIQKAKSIKEANEILQKIPGYEGRELASTFRSSWNPTRLWNNNPKIAEHYDWSRLRDTRFSNGKLGLPSDAQIFEVARSSNLGGLDLHFTVKNPYSKLLGKTSQKKSSQQTTASNFDRLRNLSSQTGKLTPQEIATINRQRVKSGKGKLTQQEIEALNQRRANRAGNTEDNSFQARLARYKQDKKDGKFNSVEDDIKRAKDELAEATRQQRLAVPTGQGSIVSPDAKEARFIMGLSKAIPTVNPSRPPITNPPAIIPRQQIEIPKPQTTPFNSQRIREGLERAQRERLGRDIGDTRIQRAIESNPERTARLQAQEAYRNVRQYFNMYGVPQYKKPLTGAARRSKQNTYNQLFGEGYYAMQDALRNRPLPHKQSNKKKKTSRDDRRTVKREEGGILDKVRKFDGGGITETARKATQYALNNNWFTNLYNQKSLTGWDSSKDASKAGVSITNQNASHGNAGDLSIPFYKNLTYTSQSNLVGQDLQSYYNSAFQGKSLEDYVNGYNANAAKIRGYWDQERAYRQAGASEHNRLFKNMFGNRSNNSNDVWNIGYDPKLDDVVGSSTWLRRMDRYEKEFDALSDEEKKARIHKIDLGGGNVGYVYKKANGDIAIWNEPVAPEQPTEPAKPASTTTVIGPEQPKKEGDTREMFSFLRNINPTIAYGLPRAVYADRMNRRMTDLAKASVTPLLKDPFQVHRYTRSDLDAEMQGERNYANLRRLASRPITSDGSLQTATQLQAEVQGQEARTAGKEKSNQTQRQYDELAWQQEKENAANRHETAMFNRAQQWGADQDKSKFEQAYLSKKFNIWDTFGQQLEYDARTKQQENKALADNFARSDIHNAVNYAPNDYGANLTPEELTVWNKVLSGTNPSSLSTQEFNSYRLAAQKVSRVETDQLRQHYNIPNTRWSGKAGVPNTPWSASISFVKKGGIISAKNGSKIAVAGIEAKTADAERFQKQIKDCIDRNEKTLDRLSKSLYGLIKASMIK